MEFYKHKETSFPVPPADTFDAAQHTEVKGIQGYQNSCYLDATLYGMFTFSNAFDILILEDVTTNAEELNLQKRLKYEIVYPLRKYVCGLTSIALHMYLQHAYIRTYV